MRAVIPFKHRPYFPRVKRGHKSEQDITIAVNWWRSKRTIRHLGKATNTLLDHVLERYQHSVVKVRRARIYIDRYDHITKGLGLPTI